MTARLSGAVTRLQSPQRIVNHAEAVSACRRHLSPQREPTAVPRPYWLVVELLRMRGVRRRPRRAEVRRQFCSPRTAPTHASDTCKCVRLPVEGVWACGWGGQEHPARPRTPLMRVCMPTCKCGEL